MKTGLSSRKTKFPRRERASRFEERDSSRSKPAFFAGQGLVPGERCQVIAPEPSLTKWNLPRRARRRMPPPQCEAPASFRGETSWRRVGSVSGSFHECLGFVTSRSLVVSPRKAAGGRRRRGQPTRRERRGDVACFAPGMWNPPYSAKRRRVASAGGRLDDPGHGRRGGKESQGDESQVLDDLPGCACEDVLLGSRRLRFRRFRHEPSP